MPPLGRKPIFLPNFTVALVRTPHLPPNFAQFVVPLNINKLDLRDYLLNAYGVEVLNIRSYIQQQKVQRTRPGFMSTNYYRPRSIKKMTVELVKPFVYPDEPEDLSPWDNDLWKALESERTANSKTRGPESFKNPKPGRSKLRELADKELAGGTKEVVGVEKEVEVEKEISIQR